MPKQRAPRILIVDDEPSIRTFVDFMLREAGYQTRTAANGGDALTIAADEPPFNLLLTDVAMPGMQGDELARQLHDRSPSTKVLYLTGCLERLFKHGSPALDDETVLEKPATVDALLERVSLLLFGHTRGIGP